MDRVLLSGPAGSGKTERVVTEVASLVRSGPVERFVVLVPTYSRAEHLKRRIVRGRMPGMFDRGIGTFEQLAERQTGRRLSELAPPAVRDALLADALSEAAVPEFREAARFPGFRRGALRFFKEVKGGDLDDDDGRGVARAAERLTDAGDGLPGLRGRKLAGLGRVLAAYQRRLAAAGLLDHEDLLRELLRHLRAAPPSPLRLLALDGFTDLTEVQERVTQLLIERAERAVVTLLADGDRTDGPFGASAELGRRLRAGSRLTEERLAVNHRAGGDLARIERLASGAPVEPRAPDGSVRFLAGADPDDEADRVARSCKRFLADDGIARRDVLVIVRSLRGDTASRVLDALARHGVAARRVGGAPLAASPAARAVLRVVRLLCGREDDGDALAAVRSGGARDVPDADADALGRAAATWGTRGVDRLLALARSEELAGAARWLEAVALRRLPDEARAPGEIAAHLTASIEPLLVFAYETGDAPDARAAADAAAVRAAASIVADAARAFRTAGRASVLPGEFGDAVAGAADEARLAPPDPRADVVNVVDAEEARQWEARAVVVAGLRLGEWPVAAREDLFVSDRDRAGVTKATRVRLASRVDEAMRRERMLFYVAVTRARERLVLTAPTCDDRGDPALRSPFLDDLLRLLPEPALEGAERSPGDVRPAPGETFGTADLERTALAALTERFEPGTASALRAETGLALFARLRASGGRIADAPRWFRTRDAALASGGPARLALARPRRRSASSLATFAQCSYRYFAGKGLGLEEAESAADDGPGARELGSVAHRVLELAVAEPARAAAIFDEVWTEHAARFGPSLRVARERAWLRRTLIRRVAAWQTDPLVPGFRPAQFEFAFGAGDAPPLVIASGGTTVELTGKIDRVDVDDRGRAVVVDYKLSTVASYSNLDRKILEGADLQLPIYVLAAERALSREVVAAGYVTLRDDGERWLRLSPAAPGGGRADVTWEGDVRAARLAAAGDRIAELDRAIRLGGIVALPRDEDRCGRGRCPYADLCRYEGGA